MSDKKIKKEEAEVEKDAEDVAAEESAAPPVEEAAPSAATAQTLPNAPAGAPPAENIQKTGIAEDSVPPLAPQKPMEAAAPPAAPEQAPAQVPQPNPELSVPEKAARRDQQQLAFMGDLQQNRIHPKTYHDLYADKGVLGKIGTMFGLMAAGAGSGLTGQPNALMDMMNKEIERDLESQKANQANKQNWYNFSLQHQMQQPEVAEKWSKAQQAENMAERTAWQNKQMGIESKIADNDARNLAGAAAIHNVQLQIDKLPEGPQKANMQNQMNNILLPNFMKEAQKRNLESESVNKFGDAVNPIPAAKVNLPPKGIAPTGKTFDVVNQQALNEKIRKGQVLGDMAGLSTNSIPPHEAPAVTAEVSNLQQSRNTYADADRAFNELAKLPRAGETPVGKIAEGAAGLAGIFGTSGAPGKMVAAGLGTLAGRGAGESLQAYFENQRTVQVKELQSRLDRMGYPIDANTLLPSWASAADPKALKEVHDRMVSIFKQAPAETHAGLMRTYGLYTEPPTYGFSVPKQKEEKKSVTEMPKEEPKEAPKAKTGIGAAASAPGIFEDYRK